MLILKKQSISGWGRVSEANVDIKIPSNNNELCEIINKESDNNLIARGLGRSYGDAAQIDLGSVIQLSDDLYKQVKINFEEKTALCGAGISIGELLKMIVPSGFFVPVSPGTRYVTIGGAIASDVHGKNHHRDGSFGNHVNSIKLLDKNGKIVHLKKDCHDNDQYKKIFLGILLVAWE